MPLASGSWCGVQNLAPHAVCELQQQQVQQSVVLRQAVPSPDLTCCQLEMRFIAARYAGHAARAL